MSECPYCHGKKSLDCRGIIAWYLFSDRLFCLIFAVGFVVMALGKLGLGQEWWGWLTMLVAFLFPIGWGHFKIFWLPIMLLAKLGGGAEINCRNCDPSSFFVREEKSND